MKMESGTPTMTIDLGYREEDVECLVSKTADEGQGLKPEWEIIV